MTRPALVHTPVLVHEVLAHLPDVKDLKVIDATLNGGGHTMAIIGTHPNAKVLGFEWDPVLAKTFVGDHPELAGAVSVVNESYVQMARVASRRSFTPHAVLMDLGLSSWHYEGSMRGFSFLRDEPLDMRFDPDSIGTTAADIVNQAGQEDLEHLIRDLGEERFAPEIAAAIIHRRRREPILTTDVLVQTVADAVPAGYRHARLHFATKTFQALRMEVNEELPNVGKGIDAALRVLSPGGRLMVISFHGGEDKLVREKFKEAVSAGAAHWVQRRTIRPLWTEIKENPRARSAKLKIIETNEPAEDQ